MISQNLDPWKQPDLFFYYEQRFSKPFLVGLYNSLSEWDKITLPNDQSTVIETLATDGKVKFATCAGKREHSIWLIQPGSGTMKEFGQLSIRDVRASELNGDEYFEFINDLYTTSVEIGRRPRYAIVTPDSGKYYVPPFTEQSILEGEIYQLGWIHIFTPDQVSRIGHNHIISAPATRIEELEEGSIALALTLGDDKQRDLVSESLGIEIPVNEDWFGDLTHDVDFVRHRAARRIESLARDGGISKARLLSHFDSEDDSVRFKLTRALHHLDGNDVERHLRHLAETDPSEAVRSMAISVIGNGEVVRDALWDTSSSVQFSALQELYRCPDESALERTVELVQSEDISTREEAAELINSRSYVKHLSEENVHSAWQALADCIDHEDSKIRQHAIEAAAKVEPEDYRKIIDTGLDDNHPLVRISAAKRYSSVYTDTEPAINCLLEIVDSDSIHVDDAVEALSTLDPHRTMVEIVPRLGQFEDHTVRKVIRKLDNIIERQGTEWTRSTLQSIGSEERAHAKTVVENSGSGGQLENLLNEM